MGAEEDQQNGGFSFYASVEKSARFLSASGMSKDWKKLLARRAAICDLHIGINDLLSLDTTSLIGNTTPAETFINQVLYGVESAKYARDIVMGSKGILTKSTLPGSLTHGVFESAMMREVSDDVLMHRPAWLSGVIMMKGPNMDDIFKALGWQLDTFDPNVLDVASLLLEGANQLNRRESAVLTDEEYTFLAGFLTDYLKQESIKSDFVQVGMDPASRDRPEIRQFTAELMEFQSQTPSLNDILSLAFVASPGQIAELTQHRLYRKKDPDGFTMLHFLKTFIQTTYESLADGLDPKHPFAIEFIEAMNDARGEDFFTLFAAGAYQRDQEGLIDVPILVSNLMDLGEAQRGDDADFLRSTSYALLGLRTAANLQDYYYFTPIEVNNAFDEFDFERSTVSIAYAARNIVSLFGDGYILEACDVSEDPVIINGHQVEYIKVDSSEEGKFVVTIKAGKILRITVEDGWVEPNPHLMLGEVINKHTVDSILHLSASLLQHKVMDQLKAKLHTDEKVTPALAPIRNHPHKATEEPRKTKRKRYRKRKFDTNLLPNPSAVKGEHIIKYALDLPDDFGPANHLAKQIERNANLLRKGVKSKGMDFKQSKSTSGTIWQFRANKAYRVLVRKDGSILEYVKTVHRSDLDEELKKL